MKVKAPGADYQARMAAMLKAFFGRQGASVLGTGTFNKPMWDKDLADDVHATSVAVAALVGKATLREFNFNPAVYDVARTVAFLRAVAERMADTINTTTQAQLKDADDPALVFAVAQNSRSAGIAVGLATLVAGFAVAEAGHRAAEVSGRTPTKTWVTGPNPRPEHAAMDGQTVGIDEAFSNGADWPGGDGEPGCNCSVELEF